MEEHILKDKWQQFRLIAIVSVVSFMITLDYGSLNISLNSIAQYFGVKVGLVAWLPTIYLLIITSTLLGFGKLGDNIGYKKVFLTGIGIFGLGALAALIALAMIIGMGFLFPFFLQIMMELSVAQTGLILMTPPLMMMLLAPITGGLSDRIGSRRLCMIGMAISALAFVIISFVTPESSLLHVVLALICMGTGMGFFIAPNNRLIMQSAPQDKQGVASGVYKIALNAGSSIGIALYTLVLSYVVIFDVSRMNVLLTEVRQHPEIIRVLCGG